MIEESFRLNDFLSEPASDMEDSIKRLIKTLDSVDATLGKLDKSQTKTAASSKKVEKSTKFQAKSWGGLTDDLKQAAFANKGMIGVLARGGAQVAALAAPFLAAGAAIGGVTLAFGAAAGAAGAWVVKSAATKQDALTSLELMTGSAKAAKDAFAFATRAGRQFGMNDHDALTRLKAISSLGFDTGESRVVFRATADVEARGGQVEPFLEKLGEIRSAGKATQDDLKALAKVARLELPTVLDTIGKQIGQSRTALAATLKSDAGLDPNDGIIGVLTSLADANGGRLGKAAEKGAQTFTKRMSRILSAPTSILNGIDMSRFTGFAAIDEAVGNLDKMLAPGSAAALRLEGVFLRLDSAVGNMFSRWTGPKGTKQLSDDLDVALRHLERMATLVDRISKPIDVTVNIVGDLFTGLDEFLNRFRSTPTDITTDPRFARKPKRRKIPAMADGGYVDKPTLALIGEAGPEIVTPVRHVGAGARTSAPAFGRSVTVHAPITITGNADRSTMQKTAEDMRAAVLDVLSDLSVQVA